MIGVNELGRVGTEAVKRLRINKLKHGEPFMINSKELPIDQCYLEYPNGKILLATFSSESRDFIILRELTIEESKSLRSRLELDYVQP